MANFVNQHRYTAKVRRTLLGAGVQGIGQYNLNQAVRTRYFNVDDLLLILNEWERRQWVQSFKINKLAKRPTTIWRATVLLRDEWYKITFDKPLPTATDSVAETPITEKKAF